MIKNKQINKYIKSSYFIHGNTTILVDLFLGVFPGTQQQAGTSAELFTHGKSDPTQLIFLNSWNNFKSLYYLA